MNRSPLIDRVIVDHGDMPVSVSFSYGTPESFPFTIVRLSAGGTEGIGEVLLPPNDFFRSFLSSLVGIDPRGLDTVLPLTDNDEDRILCEAVSIALYDLVGKLSGLPLYALLGGTTDVKVSLMPCIFPNDPRDGARKAERFFSLGYRHLKTKLIGQLDEDRERVRAIRSVAPNDVELQGDANEGYKTLSDARQAMESLGAEGLDIFEDPLLGEVEDYRALRGTPGPKLMVDRLPRRTGDLLAVLRSDATDMVNIHPDQPGSLTKGLRHVHLTADFGVPVRIGGTGYTGVGTAAYQHFTAVATPGAACGELGGYVDHGMPACTVQKPLEIEGSSVALPDTPGLGVDLDPEALARYGKEHREWPD